MVITKDHYTKVGMAATDLNTYINKGEERRVWSAFCRGMRMQYGFGPKLMLKMLNEDYPRFQVESDKLVHLEDEEAEE